MNKSILLALFASLCFVSCNSDDDSNNTDTNSIVGIWKMEKTFTISGQDNTSIIREYTPDDCKQRSTFEFNQNGKYILNDYNYINDECKHDQETINYTYNKTNNKLLLDNNESTVLELTNNKLIIYVADNYDSNEDGVNDYIKYIFVK